MSDPVQGWIQAWVAKRREDHSVSIEPGTDLYRSGLLDSLGIIELIEAMEDHFCILFTEEEMQSGLTNVEDFSRIISRHRG